MDLLGKLRNIKPEEIELMLAWRNAPNVRANMYSRHEISLNEHIAWWSCVQKQKDKRYFMYEIGGTPSGIVGFMGIDNDSRNASWAFYASPEAKKGTGSNMEFLALEYAFYKLGLHKLHCEVLAFNAPVIKMHLKFGFKVEGVLREHRKVDEAFVDVYRFGILSHEWEDHRIAMRDKLEKISNRCKI